MTPPMDAAVDLAVPDVMVGVPFNEAYFGASHNSYQGGRRSTIVDQLNGNPPENGQRRHRNN